MDKSALDPVTAFQAENSATIAAYAQDQAWQEQSKSWLDLAFRNRYMYHFEWLGRPIIQLPADLMALQEVVWQTKPDLIIEAGIAHGGSLVLNASILALLELSDAQVQQQQLDPNRPKRQVLGIDIDIRAHNRAAIEAHPMAPWITMIEGSSIDPAVIRQVHDTARNYERVLVVLDSNHTHDHVLSELEAYAPLTTRDSYCLVFDTIIEELPDEIFSNRPWSKGNSPQTAIADYLTCLTGEGRSASDGGGLMLAPDEELNAKLMLSAAPGGYLKRI